MAAVFDPPLPDGVYLDLSEQRYFAQETRGSSDWFKVRRRRHGWWWSSPYNPRRKPPETAAELVFGHALHTILLEGLAAYEARYAVEPDKLGYGKALCVTIEDMQGALRDNGFSEWPTKWKAGDFAAACRDNIPHVPVWPNIRAEFATQLGVPGTPGARAAVDAEEDFHLRFMREMATGDFPDNEPIKKLLSDDHPPLAEISVIATIDGIRRRWRFDRMFPRADTDLKSLGGWTGRPLRFASGDNLARYGWAVQRADYWNGRTAAYQMIAERGEAAIHGGTLEQRRWLLSWPEKHPTWDWMWIVFQKPASSGIAPVLMPIWDDSFTTNHQGEVIPSYLRRVGDHQLQDAIAFYREMIETFGLDRPWGRVEPLHYIDERVGTPTIVLPNWIGEDIPDDEAAYV